jgi:uncharacterized cupredoxin-like copper-binding protein
VLVAALSSGQKLGLALVAAAFIVFALISAFLIPALRPDYPARRGLPAFLTLSVALFLGMMFAVFFFGRESEEGRAEAGATESKPEQTATQAETTAPTTTAPTTTKAETQTPAPTTTAPAASKTVPVSETEFKIELPSESFSPGSYKFDLTNDGKIEHDLVVKGPGVDDEKTPVIGADKTASLTVKLQSGTYELYCSVPGHKQAGMDVKIKVS